MVKYHSLKWMVRVLAQKKFLGCYIISLLESFILEWKLNLIWKGVTLLRISYYNSSLYMYSIITEITRFWFYTPLLEFHSKLLLLTTTFLISRIKLMFRNTTLKLSTLTNSRTPTNQILKKFSILEFVSHLIISPWDLKLTLECYGPIPHLACVNSIDDLFTLVT